MSFLGFNSIAWSFSKELSVDVNNSFNPIWSSSLIWLTLSFSKPCSMSHVSSANLHSLLSNITCLSLLPNVCKWAQKGGVLCRHLWHLNPISLAILSAVRPKASPWNQSAWWSNQTRKQGKVPNTEERIRKHRKYINAPNNRTPWVQWRYMSLLIKRHAQEKLKLLFQATPQHKLNNLWKRKGALRKNVFNRNS